MVLEKSQVGSPPLLEGEGIAQINKNEREAIGNRENEGKYSIMLKEKWK